MQNYVNKKHFANIFFKFHKLLTALLLLWKAFLISNLRINWDRTNKNGLSFKMRREKYIKKGRLPEVKH